MAALNDSIERIVRLMTLSLGEARFTRLANPSRVTIDGDMVKIEVPTAGMARTLQIGATFDAVLAIAELVLGAGAGVDVRHNPHAPMRDWLAHLQQLEGAREEEHQVAEQARQQIRSEQSKRAKPDWTRRATAYEAWAVICRVLDRPGDADKLDELRKHKRTTSMDAPHRAMWLIWIWTLYKIYGWKYTAIADFTNRRSHTTFIVLLKDVERSVRSAHELPLPLVTNKLHTYDDLGWALVDEVMRGTVTT